MSYENLKLTPLGKNRNASLHIFTGAIVQLVGSGIYEI